MLLDSIRLVLSHPVDNSFVILTQGPDEAHLVSSWNSYVMWENEDTLLIPVGGMRQAEEHIKSNPKVKCITANKEVMGTHFKGVGYSIYGEADFQNSGPAFDRIKEKFSWARAVMRIKIVSIKQVLGA